MNEKVDQHNQQLLSKDKYWLDKAKFISQTGSFVWFILQTGDQELKAGPRFDLNWL